MEQLGTTGQLLNVGLRSPGPSYHQDDRDISSSSSRLDVIACCHCCMSWPLLQATDAAYHHCYASKVQNVAVTARRCPSPPRIGSVAIGHNGSILSSDDVAQHRLTLLLMWPQTSLSRRSDFQKGRTLADYNPWLIKGKPAYSRSLSTLGNKKFIVYSSGVR